MRHLLSGIISLIGWFFSLGFTVIIIGGIAGAFIYDHYNSQLPDYRQLSQYNPPNVTRLYAADGKLLAEYATEKRVFVPLSAIPKRVIHAFISAEDKNFYDHDGIDITGIVRAVRDNVINYGQGKSLVGGSTITQQVVKNFLLTNEKSIERKIKEAILAIRLSHVYSKDKILELYLNEIYLGLGSYGVAAAAQNYFNKSMDELTVEEAALLAAQPKAPALYNPKVHYERAKARRDWVISKMEESGHITSEIAKEAQDAKIELRTRSAHEITHADYFSEEVRRKLADMYGADVLYKGGLVVKTTVEPTLQKMADDALRGALIEYDRRRGYRGPIDHLVTMGAKQDDWKEQLAKLSEKHSYHMLDNQKLALVTTLSASKVTITFADETTGIIPFPLLKWTRLVIADGQLGPEVKKPSDILKVGDVVMVGPLNEEQKESLKADAQKDAWDLEQIPEINGAMVVLDPHTGRILAMSGGYSYGATEFNRATQAKRQPGSSFKPFVYMAGLENGFTPSTIIMDAPVEMNQGAGKVWKPQNYHDSYMGPTTMRVGLEKSRNTMTVRLAQIMGLDKVKEISKRFGIYDVTPNNFSMVLGAGETTLLRLVNAYGMLVNGGKRITPALIERIDDRQGNTIYRRDNRDCKGCVMEEDKGLGRDGRPPIPIDIREQVADPRVAYQIVSMMQGVATRGTGARAREIGKIVGGKTGTTNDSLDTWFVGFAPDLVAGVYVGYDKPRTLGRRETGSSVALPAFISFMKAALADQPNKPFRIPPGISLRRIDLYSGLPAAEVMDPEARIIDEAFITGGPIFIPGKTSFDNQEDNYPETQVISAGTHEMPAVSGDEALPTVNTDMTAPPPPPEQLTPPVMGTGALY
jgi:penicillin-binding protein 1A